MSEKITQEQRAHLREVAGIIEFNLTNGDVVAGYAFEVVNLAIPLLDEVERLEKALAKYADPENWTIQSKDGSEPDLWHGFGSGPDIAATALKGGQE